MTLTLVRFNNKQTNKYERKRKN